MLYREMCALRERPEGGRGLVYRIFIRADFGVERAFSAKSRFRANPRREPPPHSPRRCAGVNNNEEVEKSEQ